MASEYNVIGERKDDDQHLLVVGDDGRYYDYSLAGETMEPVEPDDSWQVDEPVAGDEEPDTPTGADDV